MLIIKIGLYYIAYIIKYLFYKILHNQAEEFLVEEAKYPRIALKVIGVPVGTNCRIHNGLSLCNYKKGNLEIGSNIHIGKRVLFDLTEKIIIGDNCNIGMGCKILTHQDLADSALAKEYLKESSPVTVGKNSCIGTNSIVLHHAVNIAENSFLAANATLMQSTQSNCLYTGSPARVKRSNLKS